MNNNMIKSFLLILVFHIPLNIFSQVGRISNVVKNSQEKFIYLFGPENVSYLFPGQAEQYISSYEIYQNFIRNNIEVVNLELKELKSRKIKNRTQIDKRILAINRSNMEIELLSEYISLWEIILFELSDFQEGLKTVKRKESCMCILKREQKYCNDEFRILSNSSLANKLYFEEIIDSVYTEIVTHLNEEGIEAYHSEDRLEPIRNNADYNYYDFVEKNIWHYYSVGFAPYKKGIHVEVKKYDQNKEDIDEILEKEYNSFVYNRDKKNLTRGKEVEKASWYKFDIKLNGEIIYPDKWSLTKCK